MSSIFNRLRTGAGKAAFETDKLRRISAVQSKVKSLQEEMNKRYGQVGYVAYTIYLQEQITQPELQEACEQLAALQAQIAASEREMESIRAEAYEASTVSSAQQYGRVCPNGHGPIPLPNNFCQTCGAEAVEISPPDSDAAVCQNCGSPLADGARFCASCGQPVSQPEPTMAPDSATTNACTHCGAALAPDHLFCTECGRPVTSEEPAQPASPAADESEEATEENERLTEGVSPFDESEEELQTAADEEAEPEEVLLSEIEPTATCPMCDTPLLADAIFCAECGHRVAEEAD